MCQICKMNSGFKIQEIFQKVLIQDFSEIIVKMEMQ